MTVVAFSADWHADEYLSRIDPESGLNARLLDYLRTATSIALEARREKAAALVIAGDLTERRHPSPWLVARIQEALAHGPKRVIVTRGNHDGAKGGRWIGDVLAQREGWEAVDRPRVIPIEDGAICAAGYLDRHWVRSQPGFETVPDADVFRVLGEQYLAIARGLYAQAKADGAKWTVLVGHQGLSGGEMSDTQQAFLGDLSLVVDSGALSAIGFEAAVFGHYHKHQTVVAGTAPIIYPGSIERVDFGEAEQPKGWVLADVAPGRFDWTFVETVARRFVTLTAPRPEDAFNVAATVVRCVDVPPDVDVAELRRVLEADGAFDITEITRARVAAPEIVGGLSESLTAAEALSAFFAEDPDRDALVERGRELLAAV